MPTLFILLSRGQKDLKIAFFRILPQSIVFGVLCDVSERESESEKNRRVRRHMPVCVFVRPLKGGVFRGYPLV